jgi:hypothetical protein
MNLECLTTSIGHAYHDKDTDKYYVSVTSHLKAKGKGIGFEKWLMKYGEEAYKIRDQAAESGSRVHQKCELLQKEGKINVEDCTEEEIAKIQGFIGWVKEFKPADSLLELSLAHTELEYAGTIDIICIIGGKRYLIDIKSGKDVHEEAWYQMAAYKEMYLQSHKESSIDHCAVLHLKANTKKGYQFMVDSD